MLWHHNDAIARIHWQKCLNWGEGQWVCHGIRRRHNVIKQSRNGTEMPSTTTIPATTTATAISISITVSAAATAVINLKYNKNNNYQQTAPPSQALLHSPQKALRHKLRSYNNKNEKKKNSIFLFTVAIYHCTMFFDNIQR